MLAKPVLTDMCIINNLLSSAAEDAGVLKEIKLSSAAQVHNQENCNRSRPSTDTAARSGTLRMSARREPPQHTL